MVKTAFLWVLALAVFPLPALTQTLAEHETLHYRVLSELGEAHARETGTKLEALMVLYNRYLRFDVDDLDGPLRARVFSSRERYDDYLSRIVDATMDDFVYLHYGDPRASELVGYCADASTCGRGGDTSLSHQAFVQFLRAFVPNPPLWLREGFAVYFELVEFDGDSGSAILRENLSWLDTLQSILNGTAGVPTIPIRELLVMDVDDARERLDTFYPQAWGLVSFLLNSSDRDINRIVWDSISALKPDSTMGENSRNVVHRAFGWQSDEELADSHAAYVAGRKSFRSLVEAGIERYEAGDADMARSSFTEAAELRGESFIPPYYLGLIAYDDGDHALADGHFTDALARGSGEPLTYYALGLNAYADKRMDDARRYLERAVMLDPTAYRSKANQLLERMGN